MKDLFHYNLYGTGSYKARLQAIAEANAKIQEELDEKKVGVDYKMHYFFQKMQLQIVSSFKSKTSLCFSFEIFYPLEVNSRLFDNF